MAYIGRYNYAELRAAVEADPTPENVNNLGEWFNLYDDADWNGEYFDADGIRIYPVFKEVAEDEFEIIGYEIR